MDFESISYWTLDCLDALASHLYMLFRFLNLDQFFFKPFFDVLVISFWKLFGASSVISAALFMNFIHEQFKLSLKYVLEAPWSDEKYKMFE